MRYEVSGGKRSDVAALRCDKQLEDGKWKLAETAEIKWVRLVQDRAGMFGIGFYQDQLVYFLGAQSRHGLIRRVSAFESIVLLRCLAGRELNLQPDVESNAIA